MTIKKPKWFSESKIMVSTAPTCGLTKGGRTLPIVDKETGKRIQKLDEETGGLVDCIDDQLLEDAIALTKGAATETLSFIGKENVDINCAVPVYYDKRYKKRFDEVMQSKEFSNFKSLTIGSLIQSGFLNVRNGHGSPSQDQRIGEIPYIKVSDLRAGLININPTNRIPLSVATKFWGGAASGLHAFDLICPERTSKNIGDFCLLMPGQERVVTTKEVIVIRATETAPFDQFYLIWALSLKIVRDQWKRIIFMQTNREDVGKRYLEIEIPVPSSRAVAAKSSAPFKKYYEKLALARTELSTYLSDNNQHHFFVAGADEPLGSELDGEESGGLMAPYDNTKG